MAGIYTLPPTCKGLCLAFPYSLTTIPFPVIAAYGGLLSLPEQPKRKSISLICCFMVSHPPVCRLHTHEYKSLKSSIICTASNHLFWLIGSRHTRSAIRNVGHFKASSYQYTKPFVKCNVVQIQHFPPYVFYCLLGQVAIYQIKSSSNKPLKYPSML